MELHPQDQEELSNLRNDLQAWRRFFNWKQKEFAKRLSTSDKTISAIEQGKTPIGLVLLSKWVAEFRHVVEVKLEDIEATSAEIEALQTLSDAYPDNGLWLEMLIVCLLAKTREDLAIPTDLMAKKLGMEPEQLELWEGSKVKPNLSQMMAYARELGGRLRVNLARVA